MSDIDWNLMDTRVMPGTHLNTTMDKNLKRKIVKVQAVHVIIKVVGGIIIVTMPTSMVYTMVDRTKASSGDTGKACTTLSDL